MRIVYLHQYFQTRGMVGVAGNRSYEFARLLVRDGHTVHVVTSRQDYRGKTFHTWTTEEDGIHAHWLGIPYSNKMSFRRRILAFAQFAIRASRIASRIEADVVFATSGPLSIAIPGMYASWRQSSPLVFEVRDLWPDGAIQLGVLTNPLFKAAARALESLAYARSRRIVALSPGIRDGIIQRGVSREKITVIPNAADLDLFHPGVDGSRLRSSLALEGRLSLAYFGTMGLANGLGFILDAAEELKKRAVDDVVFILHGDGMERASLEARVKATSLDNVIFSNPVPDKTFVAELAAAVDVCMTIYKDVPVLRTCSPNKLFDALAAGKPILTNMPGWLGDELAVKAKTGVLVCPDDPCDFADKVTWMRDHPEHLRMFSKNARALAETKFSREKLFRDLECVLQSAALGGAQGTDVTANAHDDKVIERSA